MKSLFSVLVISFALISCSGQGVHKAQEAKNYKWEHEALKVMGDKSSLEHISAWYSEYMTDYVNELKEKSAELKEKSKLLSNSKLPSQEELRLKLMLGRMENEMREEHATFLAHQEKIVNIIIELREFKKHLESDEHHHHHD